MAASHSCHVTDLTYSHSDPMNLGPQLLFVPGRLGTGTQRVMGGPAGCPQNLRWPACQDMGSWSSPQPAPEAGPCQHVSSLSPVLSFQVSPGVIANPFAAGLGHRNSLESISSIDRELSPEGPGKVRIKVAGNPGLSLSYWFLTMSALLIGERADQSNPTLGA